MLADWNLKICFVMGIAEITAIKHQMSESIHILTLVHLPL
jgi:hypothetical protein